MLQIETKGRSDSQQTGSANSNRDPLGAEEKGPGRDIRPGPLDRAICCREPRADELLLDELKLIGTDAADRAHVVLGQLGRVDLNLVATNDAHELIRLLLLSHDVLLSNATGDVLRLLVYVINNIMQVFLEHF